MRGQHGGEGMHASLVCASARLRFNWSCVVPPIGIRRRHWADRCLPLLLYLVNILHRGVVAWMKLSTMQSTVKVEFLFASNTIHRLSYSCVQWSCDHKQLVASDCVDLPAASTKRCVYTTSRKKLCTWDNMGPWNNVNAIWARLTYV